MHATSKITSIPEPRGLPWLGNVLEFRSETSLQDLDRLHDTYGEILRLRFPGMGQCVLVGSHKLVNELCDEKRFKKSIQGELNEFRHAVGDGLFTAKDEELNWGIAHRILMPAFGPSSMQNMFDEMYDMVCQMALKWGREGPSSPISASEDFTRLTLDTLALCSMGYRFNSFYREEMHPFVQSMADSLVECGKRVQRPTWANMLFRSSERKLFKDISLMRLMSDELIKARRADPNGKKRNDLLTAMLDGVDPKTGAKLSDDSIINNLVTFLIAGHETTSGTLAFAFYSMLKTPHAYRKAQQEIDEVMGRDLITPEKLLKLEYIPALLRETLRQCSPIPGITVEAKENTLLDSKYPVEKGEPIAMIFSRTHLDPAVYGDDAREFKPERMLDDNFERLQKEFPNCWKPFGNGMRGCIGRPFAWQEMLLAFSVLLQNFEIYQHDSSYVLKIAETLTIKPKEFLMRASLRHGMSPTDLQQQLSGKPVNKTKKPTHQSVGMTIAEHNISAKPISIYYGSNSGTCETLARKFALSAPLHGFRVTAVESLDLAKDRLPRDYPVIVFTASYEGQPPDNAGHFVHWLENLVGQEAEKVTYSVFGVGNSEWRQTFHRIPKLIDHELAKHGASRILPLTLTDVSKQNPFVEYESWEDRIWPTLKAKYSTSDLIDKADAGLAVDVSTSRGLILQQNVKEAVVTAERELTSSGLPRKKHLEIRLPADLTYEAGDYLTVLPINPRETVNRVFRRFRIPRDATLTISGNDAALLPLKNPTSAADIFGSYVELSLPATRRNVQTLAMHTNCDKIKAELNSIASDEHFDAGITVKSVSILDLLERYPSIELPIATFIAMLLPMRMRQYSISSSPLRDPHQASLTYSVLQSSSTEDDPKHFGVATNYLASLKPGDCLHASVRRSHDAFHLPSSPQKTPLLLIAAGAGLAPFRGFIHQRAIQIESNQILAPALLIYGCRSRGDDLYREEFDAWEAQGAVSIKRAYSRDQNMTAGCKYAQDRLLEQKPAVLDLWADGAKLFVCGSRQLGDAVEELFVDFITELNNVSQNMARKIWSEIRNERYTVDTFN